MPEAVNSSGAVAESRPERRGGLSHIRLFIPKYNSIPFEIVLEWGNKHYLRSCRGARAGVKGAISNYEDYLVKIAKPNIDWLKQFISDDYVSNSGLTKEQIIKNAEANIMSEEAYNAYMKGLNRAFQTVDGVHAKEILEALPKDMAKYAREMTFGEWRFIGPIDGKGKGAAILAGLWLSGDLETLQSLRPACAADIAAGREKDEVIIGVPILITDPKRAGQLRQQLQNLLLHLGEFISYAHFSDEEIKKANERLTKLVQEFVLDNLEVRIGLEVDPQSVTPADSTEVKEIEYKIYSFFQGEERAKKLRATWIENDYPNGVNPADYLGNPDPFKKAYFDMYLDIQVSGK